MPIQCVSAVPSAAQSPINARIAPKMAGRARVVSRKVWREKRNPIIQPIKGVSGGHQPQRQFDADDAVHLQRTRQNHRPHHWATGQT